jgi:hypothetical protein
MQTHEQRASQKSLLQVKWSLQYYSDKHHSTHVKYSSRFLQNHTAV